MQFLLRIPAAKLFISLAAKDDRIGIVSFSDKAYLQKKLTVLESDDSVQSVFEAVENISSNGKYSNIYSAIEKSFELLLQGRKSERSQNIILLSDGKMQTDSEEKDIELINKLKEKLLPKFRKNKIKIFTIALGNLSDNELFKQISLDTDGVFYLCESDHDLYWVFTRIFENIDLPEIIPLKNNQFNVDQSWKILTLVLSKKDYQTNIYLQSPAGDKIYSQDAPKNINWLVSNNFDKITFEKPQSGTWQIFNSFENKNKVYLRSGISLETNLNNLSGNTEKEIEIKGESAEPESDSEVDWGKTVIKFLVINFVFGGLFYYLKRKKIYVKN